MTGSDFDSSIHIKVKGGEINFFRASHANVNDSNPYIHQTFGKSQLQRLAGFAHIAANNHTPDIQVCA